MNQKKIPPVKEYSGSPFWPPEILGEAGVVLLAIALLFFLAALLPAPLGEPADPTKTLTPLYPEWYFLPVYGFVRFWTTDIGPVPAKLVGLFAPVVVGILLLLLPFYDSWDAGSGEGKLKHIRRRKRGAVIGVSLLAGALLMASMAIMLEKNIVKLEQLPRLNLLLVAGAAIILGFAILLGRYESRKSSP